jgi:hypothetical protein
MIDLDFVKKIDKNWEKNINKIYIKKYNENYCINCGSIIDNIN